MFADLHFNYTLHNNMLIFRAPLAYSRFQSLVSEGYYTNNAFWRVITNTIPSYVQFGIVHQLFSSNEVGINPSPKVTEDYDGTILPNEFNIPQPQHNLMGFVAFAGTLTLHL